MLTLSWPNPSIFAYPKAQFGRLDNLRRQTEINRKAFKQYVFSGAFNLENEHILVGLLQQLSIDPSWDLEYVIKYTQFRSYSLCTPFKITSPSKVGEATYNGFYRDGTLEHWCLIEQKYDYNKVYDLDTATPIVPLYCNHTYHSYKPMALKDKAKVSPPKGLAVIGLDLVSLAVGWWYYMQDPANDGTGITNYLCKYPLVNAQLVHNQLASFNVLYEHLVNGKPLNSLITSEVVNFITVSEQKLLTEYIEFLSLRLTGNRLFDLNHLMVQLVRLYQEPFNPFVRAGNAALYSQTCWAWEPAIMKMYHLYLTLANEGDYKASDINTIINRTNDSRVNNYQRIPEKVFRDEFIDLSNKVWEANKENM